MLLCTDSSYVCGRTAIWGGVCDGTAVVRLHPCAGEEEYGGIFKSGSLLWVCLILSQYWEMSAAQAGKREKLLVEWQETCGR